jgi:lactate racemase
VKPAEPARFNRRETVHDATAAIVSSSKSVRLAYGRSGLTLSMPAQAEVIEPRYPAGLRDERDAILRGLRQPINATPLAAQVGAGSRVVITHSDITRATPNDRILPVVLAELEAAGVRREDITLINALGTHRVQTDAELRRILGGAIVDGYRCLQHDARDDANLVRVGEVGGRPLRLNRQFVDADLRVVTGFIEPHFFAGFSGGPKGVLPALAGAESVLTNHGYSMIADARATWGVTQGNPVWEEMRSASLLAGPIFLLNVALDSRQEITGVFAGDLVAAHADGCAFVRNSAMVPVSEPYDIVVTTNGGYPLDQNLYQTVKGMSAASRVVKNGGAIIMAAACEDGLPDHGKYTELLVRGGSPGGVLEMLSKPGFAEQDQWQVQLQAMIQLQADVYVYSEGLSDEQIRRALFTPTRDVPATIQTLQRKHGPRTRIGVLSEGPQTVAYLKA